VGVAEAESVRVALIATGDGEALTVTDVEFELFDDADSDRDAAGDADVEEDAVTEADWVAVRCAERESERDVVSLALRVTALAVTSADDELLRDLMRGVSVSGGDDDRDTVVVACAVGDTDAERCPDSESDSVDDTVCDFPAVSENDWDLPGVSEMVCVGDAVLENDCDLPGVSDMVCDFPAVSENDCDLPGVFENVGECSDVPVGVSVSCSKVIVGRWQESPPARGYGRMLVHAPAELRFADVMERWRNSKLGEFQLKRRVKRSVGEAARESKSIWTGFGHAKLAGRMHDHELLAQARRIE
jgi:hypothetical protein